MVSVLVIPDVSFVGGVSNVVTDGLKHSSCCVDMSRIEHL